MKHDQAESKSGRAFCIGFWLGSSLALKKTSGLLSWIRRIQINTQNAIILYLLSTQAGFRLAFLDSGQIRT